MLRYLDKAIYAVLLNCTGFTPSRQELLHQIPNPLERAQEDYLPECEATSEQTCQAVHTDL